ncbi:group II intron maturase-specific domain-containing protein [Paenibacillus durus]|uniref:group II intron maturase-specific domain-containing protein n=1 Tax=Paenibacillus durus TaxID=44251 RepID=UPI001C54DDD6|nr:group II intron maturase-specific domain-containing protein [Paenibacillus durus]
MMEEVKAFIRGWLGYYYVADMKRILQSWNEWLRRRFRMYTWKQWKKPRTRVQNLRRLGIPGGQAYLWEILGWVTGVLPGAPSCPVP